MKNTLLMAVSVLTLGMVLPAHAETQDSTVTQKLEQGWEDTKDAVSDAAETVSEATSETYHDIKKAIMDENNKPSISTLNIEKKMTAEGLIGAPVKNASGERVAKVSDVILNKDGDAEMIILADGDFTGLGKNVAFNHNIIANLNSEGDVIAPLTEEIINQAKTFSYDAADSADNVVVMPADDVSVAKLMDADITDAAGNVLASVNNISFNKDGSADQLIVEFNQTLGMGGNRVALNYDDLALVSKDQELNFQMTAAQATEFENFKKSLSN